MATGWNYIAPQFREIRFNSLDAGIDQVDAIVPVPSEHTVVRSYNYQELKKVTQPSIFDKITSQAPSGSERMYVVSLENRNG